MPWFVGIARDVLFSRRISEDKTIFWHNCMKFGEDFVPSEHVVGTIDDFVVFNKFNINGESGMMFGVAGDSNIMITVVFAAN